MKIVIRAGGVGSRLWPVSRIAKPKQFHAFASKETMLQDAVQRISSLVGPSDIFVSVNSAAFRVASSQLRGIPKSHFIVEPARRDTAASVGLEAIFVHHEDPDAVIASLGSDHVIAKPKEFCRLLKVAESFVQQHPDYLVTLGVMPHDVETGYGHIRMGKVLGVFAKEKVYQVHSFVEKPSYAVAKKYTESGQYLWNSNMFVWRADTILKLFARFMPKMYQGLMEIQQSLGTKRAKQVIADVYPRLEKISIDYAIIEKTSDIAVIPADVGWTDIGSWKTLADVLPQDRSGNLWKGRVLNIGSKRSLVYAHGEKLIATIGLEDIVIVDTPDALLVCRKDLSQKVKQVVEKLEAEGQDQYL